MSWPSVDIRWLQMQPSGFYLEISIWGNSILTPIFYDYANFSIVLDQNLGEGAYVFQKEASSYVETPLLTLAQVGLILYDRWIQSGRYCLPGE